MILSCQLHTCTPLAGTVYKAPPGAGNTGAAKESPPPGFYWKYSPKRICWHGNRHNLMKLFKNENQVYHLPSNKPVTKSKNGLTHLSWQQMVERYKTNTYLGINLCIKKHNVEFIDYLSLKTLLLPTTDSWQDGYPSPLKNLSYLLYIKVFVKYWANFSKIRYSKNLSFLESSIYFYINNLTRVLKSCCNLICDPFALEEFRLIPVLWPPLSQHFQI